MGKTGHSDSRQPPRLRRLRRAPAGVDASGRRSPWRSRPGRSEKYSVPNFLLANTAFPTFLGAVLAIFAVLARAAWVRTCASG
jgi:hypothetical protein